MRIQYFHVKDRENKISRSRVIKNMMLIFLMFLISCSGTNSKSRKTGQYAQRGLSYRQLKNAARYRGITRPADRGIPSWLHDKRVTISVTDNAVLKINRASERATILDQCVCLGRLDVPGIASPQAINRFAREKGADVIRVIAVGASTGSHYSPGKERTVYQTHYDPNRGYKIKRKAHYSRQSTGGLSTYLLFRKYNPQVDVNAPVKLKRAILYGNDALAAELIPKTRISYSRHLMNAKHLKKTSVKKQLFQKFIREEKHLTDCYVAGYMAEAGLPEESWNLFRKLSRRGVRKLKCNIDYFMNNWSDERLLLLLDAKGPGKNGGHYAHIAVKKLLIRGKIKSARKLAKISGMSPRMFLYYIKSALKALNYGTSVDSQNRFIRVYKAFLTGNRYLPEPYMRREIKQYSFYWLENAKRKNQVLVKEFLEKRIAAR